MLAASAALLGCAPFNRAELRREAGTVQALAAEGALLADQVAQVRTREAFVRVHADELAAQADHAVEKLYETQQEGEVPAELARPTARTATLAQEVSDALDALGLNPGDARRARRLRTALEETSRAAEKLMERL